MSLIKLEICSFSIQGCLNARSGGADRIELCSSPGEGGTTPSFGLVREVRETIDVPLYPIIRPRGGNFRYNDEEFQIMVNDVLAFKQLECKGVAVGVQSSDGKVDKEKLKYLSDLAWPMGITYIRAFDLAHDAYQAIDDISSCGCERILTSGLAVSAIDAQEFIRELVQYAGDRISIMAGSGIKPENVKMLVEATGVREVHASLREPISDTSDANTEKFGFGYGLTSSLEQIKKIRKVIDVI
jgi:copper homeostasis protein